MLAPWKKSYDKPRQLIEKQTYHFADKGPYSQTYVFSTGRVRMWELDHKEAECQKTDACKLWCWTRLLRVPWTARRSSQSILMEASPKYSLEKTLMLERLKAGEGDDRGWDGWMASLIQWTWVLAKLQEILKDREAWSTSVHGITNSWRGQSDWITTAYKTDD